MTVKKKTAEKKPQRKRTPYEVIFRTDNGNVVLARVEAYSETQAISCVIRREGWQGFSVMTNRLSARIDRSSIVRAKRTTRREKRACKECGYVDPAYFSDRCPNCDAATTARHA